MLLDEGDLTDEQNYHDVKRRLRNRMLYGAGVVCGLNLTRIDRTSIEVSSGLAFDCKGNEIWVNCDFTIRIKDLLPKKKGEWDCPPKTTDPPPPYYLCISHRETKSDWESTIGSGGSCESKNCEHSRIREGFCFELLEECPCPIDTPTEERAEDGDDSSADAPVPSAGVEPSVDGALDEASHDNHWERLCCDVVPCPCAHPCEETCVVLGKVSVDQHGCIDEVSAKECRTYVVTGAMVRHLVTALLSWKMDPEKAACQARNPIEALCRYLGANGRTEPLSGTRARSREGAREPREVREELEISRKAKPRQRCKGTTKEGERCNNLVMGEYCRHHTPEGT